jgi:pimeloyl-ACP methyl ester carboxylesterase
VAPVPEVEERTEDVGGVPVFWRTAGEDDVPVLYVHGVPDNSDTWVPFLERGGGLAPDLLGFGRSAKRGDLDFSIAGYDAFLERFLAHVGVGRVRLVVHDWGAAALAWAQRFPERVERLVIVDSVPLLPGYRWHRVARAWRTPLLGEVAMGLSSRRGFRRALPEQVVESVWPNWDQGTQRAILRLYRSAPPDVLEAAGRDLGKLTCPTLVVWGDQDPYLEIGFARAYADALGGEAEVEIVEGAGHWPWLDRPELVDRIVEFASAR